MAIGVHRQSVRVLPQCVVVEQAQRGGECGLVLSPRLLSDHQPRQRFGEQGFQPVALVDDPVIVEAIQKVAPVERHCRLQTGKVIVRDPGFEFINIEPQVRVGIKLYRVRIAQDELFVGQTATDMPQGRGEGAARLALRPAAPEEIGQPVPRLGPVPMEGQVRQQGLRFERGGLRQLPVVVADV